MQKLSVKYLQMNSIIKSLSVVMVSFIPEMQKWFHIHKPTNIIHYINRRKVRNHMIIYEISCDAERPLKKIQQSFMIKVLEGLGSQGMYLSAIVNLIKNFHPGIHCMLSTFSPILFCPFHLCSPLCFSRISSHINL